MVRRIDLYKTLMTGASVSVLMIAPQAFAQQAAASSGTGLEEVVVTATRQVDTVNRVALSIAAVTQQTLNQQGIKEAADITRLVPGLNISQTANTNAVGNFAIRGIVGGVGAATVGVYLDDTSITKRSNSGLLQQNGAPLPLLYDLERVEVLKGPQGTLYGGSSEGGTVRFITPNPSLTTWSGDLRAEGRTVEGGDTGYEFAGAAGGPIIQDKVGVRLSGIYRRTPGYIDLYFPYGPNGSPGTTLIKKDANGLDEYALHGSALWQVTERGSVELTAYAEQTTPDGGPNNPTAVYSKTANGSLASPTETFTTPAVCINTQTRNLATQPIVAYNPALPLLTSPSGTAVIPAGCTASTPAAAQFNRPSYTYGPFPQGKNIAYQTTGPGLQTSNTRFDVLTFTGSYHLNHVDLKSITSYLEDETHSTTYSSGGLDIGSQQSIVGGPVFGATSTSGNPPGALRGFPLWAPNPAFGSDFVALGSRTGFEEELRASSPAGERPISWVAGLYYSNQYIHNHFVLADTAGGTNDAAELGFFGVTAAQRYGNTDMCGCQGFQDADLTDKDYAAYGEATWSVTDKLKLNAGLRYSELNFAFVQFNYGQTNGRFPNSFGSYINQTAKSTPLTPKFNVEYDFTPNDIVYLTAAKGFRAGGANQAISQAICQTALDQFGIKATDVPTAYAPDSVWNYELGSKLRLLDNKLQLNTALYRIDWTGVQATVTLSCGLNFVENGGRARSQGFDFQGSYRPIQPLTLGLNVGYDNAYYIDAVAGPKGAGIGPNSINPGDPFAVPPWQGSASARYDLTMFSRQGYVRGDYQYMSGFVQPGSFGTAAYNPNTRNVPAFNVFNARVGMMFGKSEINVYANNLFDTYGKVNANAGNGQTGCVATSGPSCSVYGTFSPFVQQAYQRPREIGIQANYHF